MARSCPSQMSKYIRSSVKTCMFSRRQASVCATGLLCVLSRARICTTPTSHISESGPTAAAREKHRDSTLRSRSTSVNNQEASVDKMAGTTAAESRCQADRKLLEKRFGWLNDHVPCFGVNGDNITVIEAPVNFYETLKSMVKGAERRIVIASLYLGAGELEKQLVETIEEAIENSCQEQSGGRLEVHMLFDYQRGSRGPGENTRTMLLPLLEKYSENIHVYLYHSPDLSGWLKKLVPERINEAIGLHHMKIYLTDDDFIISGANLQDQYFVNRQDRFIHFRSCPEMADYLTNLVKTVSTFSFQLNSNNTTSYPADKPHPYEGSGVEFKEFARNAVIKMTSSVKTKHNLASEKEDNCSRSESSDVDTWLFPLLQMGQMNIFEEEEVTKKLFTKTEEGDKIYLTSGYFNLTREYSDVLLDSSKAEFDILSAAPEANGFFNSSGMSYYIPTAYTHIASQFYQQVCNKCQEQRITLHEFIKPHWTFHCKGLWYYLPNSTLPSLTFIGSTNFGYRSVFRDVECQVAVVTTNDSLRQQLKQEQTQLYGLSYQVTEKTFQKPDRHVPLWARFATGFIRQYF